MQLISLSRFAWRFVIGLFENLVVMLGLGLACFLLLLGCYNYVTTVGVSGTWIAFATYTLFLTFFSVRATGRMFIGIYDSIKDLHEYRSVNNEMESALDLVLKQDDEINAIMKETNEETNSS